MQLCWSRANANTADAEIVGAILNVVNLSGCRWAR